MRLERSDSLDIEESGHSSRRNDGKKKKKLNETGNSGDGEYNYKL